MGVLDQPMSVLSSTGFAGTTSAASPLDQPAIATSAGPAMSDLSASALLSLRNPVTWFGIIAAVTFGLIAVSSTVRVGKAKATATVGKE